MTTVIDGFSKKGGLMDSGDLCGGELCHLVLPPRLPRGPLRSAPVAGGWDLGAGRGRVDRCFFFFFKGWLYWPFFVCCVCFFEGCLVFMTIAGGFGKDNLSKHQAV